MPPREQPADTFVRDGLPPRAWWPAMHFDLPEVRYPEHLNCAVELLHRNARERPQALALVTSSQQWSYGALAARTNQIARVLMEDLGVMPGHRVLLRGTNSPMLVACWLAAAQVGAVVVATMPMLRAHELSAIIDKAQVGLALCEQSLQEELLSAARESGTLRRTVCWGSGELESLLAHKPESLAASATRQDDPCLLAFTSGTTGKPKATVHFHRDVLAMADTFARYLLAPDPSDRFAGTPPLAFTYGLGAELVFPFRFGAAAAILSSTKPDAILDAVDRFGITRLFTAPTAYRAMLPSIDRRKLGTLRTCVSAGEHLPQSVSDDWFHGTGQRIADGIGSTEMTHVFISAAGKDIRPGSTGKAVPGYRAQILDAHCNPVPAGTVGRLAVQGPTGCRYFADERQRDYVVNGWNLTGDAFVMDEEGYFWFQARTDDMIVSSGYNIAGPDVESSLLRHPGVSECAVVGVEDADRGQIVKAFVVLNPRFEGTPALAVQLQEFVKRDIAPYKFPRAIRFIDRLPRTSTGKVQRFKLREL